MTMKKNLIWNVAALMYALCMLTACNGDNDDENAPREGLKLLEHHVDEYSFREVIEDYSGPSSGIQVEMICYVCELYGYLAKSDIKTADYLGEAHNYGYVTVSRPCWAFYNSTVERDFFVEY